VQGEITTFCAYYHHFADAIIWLMYDEGEIWERRSIELPPGWHGVMTELAQAGRVKLKYLYSVAIDRMLRQGDFDRIVKAAWDLDQQAREDIRRVGVRHRRETVEKWAQKREQARARPATSQRKQRTRRPD